MNRFPNRLKYLRKAYKFTQRELAEKIGVSQPLLAGFESGNKEPGIDQIISLAKIFNCTTDYLLGISDDPPIELIDENMEYKPDINKPVTTDYLAGLLQSFVDISVMELVSNYGKLSPSGKTKVHKRVKELLNEERNNKSS